MKTQGHTCFFLSVLPADSGSWSLWPEAGDERDGGFISYNPECRKRRDVLPDADECGDYTRSRKCVIRGEGGSDQYLADRDAAVFRDGIRGKGVPGGGGMLPERGSDLQVCAGIPYVALWELDQEADAGMNMH